MSVDASSVTLANAFIRAVNSAADTHVAHSANSAIVQRIHDKTSVRRTKLRRNLSVNQSDLTLGIAHDEWIMSRSQDSDPTLFIRML